MNFSKVTEAAFKEFKSLVPNPKTRYVKYYINAYGNVQKGSTGNMALNASHIKHPDEKTAIIYVDENIAPYVYYTNEPWESPFWKGKKNPNEGWFEKAADRVANILSQRLKGNIKK